MKTARDSRRIDRRRLVQMGGGGAASAAVFGLARGRNTLAQTPEASPGETRTVEHALGTTEIPANPQRIVVLDNSSTIGYLAALDVWPYAALAQDAATPDQDRSLNFPAALYPWADGIIPIEGDQEYSIEDIIQLEPDLLVAAASYVQEQYNQLSQIAPTLGLEYTYTPYPDLRIVAAVLGIPERVDLVQQRIEDEVEAIGQRVDVESGQTITFSEISPDGQLRIFNAEFLIVGQAALKLGLQPDPSIIEFGASPEDLSVDISPERTGELDGDYLVFFAAVEDGSGEEELARIASTNPLFAGLPAVQNDQVVVVDDLSAGGAGGLDGWLATLQALEAVLTGS